MGRSTLPDPVVRVFGSPAYAQFVHNAPLVVPAGTTSQIQLEVHIGASSGAPGFVADTNHIHLGVEGLWQVQAMQFALTVPPEMPQSDLDARKVHLDPFFLPGVEYKQPLVSGKYQTFDLLALEGAGPNTLCLFTATADQAYHFWARNLTAVDVTIESFSASFVRLSTA